MWEGWGRGGSTDLLGIEDHRVYGDRSYVDALVGVRALVVLVPEECEPPLDGVLAVLGELRALDRAGELAVDVDVHRAGQRVYARADGVPLVKAHLAVVGRWRVGGGEVAGRWAVFGG